LAWSGGSRRAASSQTSSLPDTTQTDRNRHPDRLTYRQTDRQTCSLGLVGRQQACVLQPNVIAPRAVLCSLNDQAAGRLYAAADTTDTDRQTDRQDKQTDLSDSSLGLVRRQQACGLQPNVIAPRAVLCSLDDQVAGCLYAADGFLEACCGNPAGCCVGMGG
jgi:hypothetical protein